VDAGSAVTDTQATLQLARDLLSRVDPSTAGLWPRAAALLIRQALEEAVDAYWTTRQLPLESVSTQTQLVCLRMMTADNALRGQLHEAWGSLSRACHHHPYELAPTAGELATWIEVVEEFGRRPDRP
jgi:cytochrome c5